MTTAEHATMQRLEGQTKRYRSRIVEMKAAFNRINEICTSEEYDRHQAWSLIAMIAQAQSAAD